jgi:hypothetical protein
MINQKIGIGIVFWLRHKLYEHMIPGEFDNLSECSIGTRMLTPLLWINYKY